MRFNGTLQTQGDPHGWLKSSVNLVGGRVEIVAGEETLGSWSVSQVKAERIEGNRFDLVLGDDRAVFVADDALAFSYEALPQLTKNPIAEVAQGFRQKLLGSARKAAKAAAPVAPEPAPAPTSSLADNIVWQDPPPEAPANVKRLRELIEAARANRAESEEASEESDEPPAAKKVAEVAVLAIDPPMRLIDSAAGPDPEPLWAGSELGRRIIPPAEVAFIPPEQQAIEPAALEPIPLEPIPLESSPAGEPLPISVEGSSSGELVNELEQLMKWVSSNHLNEAQAQAVASLVRSVRALLDS